MVFVPRHRASVVCRHGDRLLTVRAVDPASGRRYLFLPGGEIEPAESPAAAAVREAKEETGYDVAVDPSSELVLDYRFHWAGRDVDCRTHFFRATLQAETATAPSRRANEHFLHEVEWVPVAEIESVFGYHDEIRRAVLALV